MLSFTPKNFGSDALIYVRCIFIIQKIEEAKMKIFF